MRRKLVTLGMVGLIILGVTGCSKNKFKLTRSEPTDIPYYNPSNDTCFVCHTVSTLKKTIGNETVPLYVNREKFARSTHRANRCVDCHTDITFHKGHSEIPKSYGGWVNLGAEDTSQTINYTTKASIACVNCHTHQLGFLSSQHYLIEDINNSYQETNKRNGIKVGRDYDVAKCAKCHLTCSTCHFKGQKVQTITGEITDYWSDLLLNGITNSILYNGLTNWAIDWTTNVEAHDFATGEELENSSDLCRVCHTGMYTNYKGRGYYVPKDSLDMDSVVSQGVYKYPQYEELKFLFGNIPVNTGIPSLDNLYAPDTITNDDHAIKKCLDCHNHSPAEIHSLALPSCKDNGCHPEKIIEISEPHSDVACVACHDATMNVWRDPKSGNKVRVAAIIDNKVINWHSHMLIKPDGEKTNFCDRRCHNAETDGVGAPHSHSYTGTIHD